MGAHEVGDPVILCCRPEGLSVHLWCAGGVDAWDLIRSSLGLRL
jgi:hypothetical protein